MIDVDAATMTFDASKHPTAAGIACTSAFCAT
jgi:hypothetical protein